MKQVIYTVLGALLGVLFLFIMNRETPLKLQILSEYDLQGNPPSFELIYSDISMQDIEAYLLKGHHLFKQKTPLQSYTEGVISAEKYKNYISLINKLRISKGETKLSYFHDYYEDEKNVVISFSGPLSHIYIIDKATHTAHNLSFDASLELGAMYVSHVKKVGDTLILLGAKAHSYEALVYSVSLKDYHVTAAHSVPTPPGIVGENAFAITDSGECVFADNDQLVHYNPFTSQTNITPLSFRVSGVYSKDNTILATSLSEDRLYYTLLNDHYEVIKKSSVLLPAPHTKIVSLSYNPSQIYLATYHDGYSIYPNYISIYNLKDSELSYCAALGERKSKALLYMYLH